MSASDRAYKLNAAAVGKLNQAVLGAQAERGEPDIAKIAGEVMSGKRVVELTESFSWAGLLFWLVAIALFIAAGANEKLAKVLYPLVLLFVFLPFISAIFSMIGEWFSSINRITFGNMYGGPAAKCGVAGCSSSASYAFDPTGYQQIHLCYDDKTRFENRVRYAPFFRPDTAKAIVAAYKDLLKASKLDPGSPVIEQNLEQARELAEIVLERKL
jgi:hypothetical protein